MTGYTGLWVVVFTNMALAWAAGEVSIRYFSWWLLLKRSRERLVMTPALLGFSMVTAAFYSIEVNWLIVRANNARLPGMTDASIAMEVARICLFLGLCYTTYPVTKIQYQHSWEKALTETIVRVFIGITAFVFGAICHGIYIQQMLGRC